MSGVELILLRCPECSSDMKGDKEGVFVFCKNCGRGFERIVNDLQPVPVYFARLDPQYRNYLPFWAFDSELKVVKRDASASFKSFFSSSSGILQLFEKRSRIRFYVPAYLDDLTAEKPIGLRLTLEQPELEYVHPCAEIRNFHISKEDARKIADFLFLTSEIQQPDTLRSIQYNLFLNNPIVIMIALS